MQNQPIKKKRLWSETFKSFMLFFCSLGMLTVSSYLIYHFYDLHFPDSFQNSAICHLSQTWNCDLAALSPLGSFFSVPTGVFGLFMGGLCLSTFWIKSLDFLRTVRLISLGNSICCVGFLLYSLFWLKSFCPGCMVYYVFSWVFCVLFFDKKKSAWIPSPTHLLFAGLFLGALWNLFYWSYRSSMSHQDEAVAQIVKEMKLSKNFDSVKLKSTFAFDDHDQAPLKVVFFSDFECAACKILSEMIPKFLARYGHQISIRYSFYPLDSSCNGAVNKKFHKYACQGALYAYCGTQKHFVSIHDELYDHQDRFDDESFFDTLKKKYDLGPCLEDPESLKELREIVQNGHSFDISATPTILVNGYKIEGLFPLSMMFLIFDHFLQESHPS